MSSPRALGAFIFNLAGRFLPLVLMLVTFPIVIRYIGVAQYGVIGVVSVILAFASIVDIAFSNTVNREISLHGVAKVSHEDLGATIRTLEALAWLTGIVLAALVVVAGPLLETWVGADKYSGAQVASAARWISLLVLLQIPVSFYGGCLYGMGRHDLTNATALLGGFAGVGLAVFFVTQVSPTADAYLIGQILGRGIALLFTSITARRLLRRMVSEIYWRMSREVLARHWRFAFAMNSLGALNLLGVQADVFVASRMLSALDIGYYMVARTLTQAVLGIAMSGYLSALPELTQRFGAKDAQGFRSTFRTYAQLLALALLPVVLVLGAFGELILRLWTHDAELSRQVAPLLQSLLVGVAAYGLGVMFSAVFMAHGAVRSLLWVAATYLVLVIVFVPALEVIRGPNGIALGVAVASVGSLALAALLCRSRFLRGTVRDWLRRDVLMPVFMSAIPIAIACSIFDVDGMTPVGSVALISVVATLAICASAAVLPFARNAIALVIMRR